MTMRRSSASGIAVTYNAHAVDAVDGTVPGICQPPSASTFAVGATTVECTATDSRGNTASGGFTVMLTRPSPADLLRELIALVAQEDIQQGSQLLSNALRGLENGNLTSTCNQVSAFSSQVRASNRLQPEVAARLPGLAAEFRAAAGGR